MHRTTLLPALCWFFLPTCVAQEAAHLEELTVTAHRIETQSVLPVETLRHEEIEARASPIGAGILAPLTGLAISRAGAFGTQTQVRVRGAEANHLQVVIDGIEVNDPATGSEFAFAHLDLAGIERIEFLPGAQSALWGSDALAGVLQLISRRQAARGAEVWAGSHRERFAKLELGADDEARSYQLTLSDFSTDGTNIAAQGDERDGYAHTSAHFSGRAEGQRFAASLVLRHTDALSEFDATSFPTFLPTDGDNESAMRLNAGKIAFDARLLHGRLHQVVEFKGLRTRTRTHAEGSRISSFEGRRDTLASLSHVRLSASQTLTALLEYEQETFEQAAEASVYGDPNYAQTMRTRSIGLEHLTDLGRLSSALSARFDDHSAFQNIASYRAAARYALRPNLSLFASVGTGTKNPTFIERFGYTPNSFIGNPALRPEYSRQLNFGLDWRAGEGLALRFTLFRNRLEDEINGFAWVGGGFSAVNLDGRSHRSGGELQVRFDLVGNRLSAAYSFTDSETPDGVREVRRPRHQGYVSLARTLLDDRLEINLGARLQGEGVDLDFSTGQQRFVALGKRELVHLTARYRLSDAFTVVLRIENALDDREQEVYGFMPPGRSYAIGVRANW